MPTGVTLDEVAPDLTLRNLIFPSRATLWAAVAATLAAAIASTAMMALVSELIANPQAWATGFVFIGTCAAAIVTGFIAQYSTARVLERTAHELRMRLMTRVLRLPYRRIEAIGAPRMGKALTEDLRIVASIGPQVVQVATQLAVIMVCFAYLAFTSWVLFLWILPVLFVVGMVWVMPRLARRPLEQVSKAEETMYGHFHGLAVGAKELKMDRVRREGWLSKEVVESSLARQSWGLRVWRIFIAFDNVARLLPLIIIGGLIFVVEPLQRFERATIVVFVFTILYIVQPIRSLAGYVQEVGRARVALRRIRSLNVFQEEQEPLDRPLLPLEPHCDLIEAKSLSLHYAGESDERGFCMGPTTFQLGAGELLFVIGGNGSGKTTLIKLLAGLYSPTSGELALNGTTVDDTNRDWYRQHISAVFADFHLFENLHCDAAAQTRARDYLKRLRLDGKVQIEDGKLTTLKLSAGQRRRLALVAAFLHERPICIFDEWAADQDPEFKRFFYVDFLRELTRAGKAVIVITHDDRYFDVADRILKLEEGQPLEVTDLPGQESVTDTKDHEHEPFAAESGRREAAN